ncbi:hypothetical protein Pst134EA_021359 [Puccinia striiformis f. sp. tritici]|uniref:uncharacterized protein n=1 Tax=Puccinia striiformis f. sp. tritici TaxID=168172 RepID=UPI002007C98B|nr:uncharacterized protein Pst134EA_031781 [Puccinia striiformis f. sp. tritici]XP_047802690.1 hypothetical protein Pst134EA_021359 [Puccinia striiformis f. sp. tritici]KAH9445178.1 hypothetical protein Pst134EA_031781 [Puccinia striiformis f. sp. tritici]KAH9457484.1 hypothetical protein Pst134EA_021359 [Puccinia striiformis f. sp. tritici]KAI9627648.1 hypothetical protein KEM48_012111 [Puccinia striiformis f. sp. tritici PST-130]
MISFISVDECFSSPQPPNIKSERLKVKVKSHGTSLTVAELKKAIVRKGYPSLCDASRITLIWPVGDGCVLEDDMMASELEDNASLLALMTSTPREASYLHADGGLNIPHILYVYHSSTLRTHVKFPHSVMVPYAGQWTSWQTSWSASFSELFHQFTGVGFDQSLVTHELKRLEHRRLPEDIISSSHYGAGILAPSLLFRLWDAAGLNRLVSSQRQSALRTGRFAPSEFEVFSASSSYSVDTDTTEGTVLGETPPASPFRVRASTSNSLPPPAPSVIMASPSEHESAYDDVFYQSFSSPPSTVNGSDCSSEESGRFSPQTPTVRGSNCSSLSSRSYMDWTSGHQPSASSSGSSPSQLSQIVRKVADLTRERNRLVSDSLKVKQQSAGDQASFKIVRLLEQQAAKFELERIQYNKELQLLTEVNEALREEVQQEVNTLKEVFEQVHNNNIDLNENQINETNLKTLRDIKDTLSTVLTCSICCERYGSLSSNIERRPIHLSCGHIFCATCLDQDWFHRASQGLEPHARCFNRCPTFDVHRLAEIYLLDDVNQVLEQVPDIQMN